MCDQKFITAHSSETCVAFAEQLHAHDCEDEDDDTEDESEVSQSTNGFPHNGDEEVERRPGLGQLEHSQLGEGVVDDGQDVDEGNVDNNDDSELDQFRASGKLNSRLVESGIRISQWNASNLEIE